MIEDRPVLIKPFGALSLLELHACYKLRGEVFVVGQQICCEAEVDEIDPRCHHVMLWRGGDLAGTARLLPIEGGAVVKVGRVAVGEGYRGRGLGRALMRGVQAWIDGVPGRTGVMSAQAYLEGWYTQLGWRSVGGRYDEAQIPHVKMVYERG
ncbi:MAG: GNAT family N-acetyltransferase [Planctomycetota bacterium]